MNDGRELELKLIDENTQRVEVYYQVEEVLEEFCKIVSNIPKNLVPIAQHIFGRLDDAAYYILRAANTTNYQEKVSMLQWAKFELYFIFSSIESLVKAHGISIHQANSVIEKANIAYNAVGKWEYAMRTRADNSTNGN